MNAEELIEYGPLYMSLLHQDGLDPNLIYKNKSPYNCSRDFPLKHLYCIKVIVDFSKMDYNSNIIPLKTVKEYAIKDKIENSYFSPRYEVIQIFEMKFEDIVNKFFDKLYPNRYRDSDLEYYKKAYNYTISDKLDYFEEIPFCKKPCCIGSEDQRGTASAYYEDCGVDVEIYSDIDKSRKSLFIDYETIKEYNRLMEFKEVADDMGLDLDKIVDRWNELKKAATQKEGK